MLTIAENVPLAPHTTFGIGGTADFFAVIHTEAELQEAVTYAHERSLGVTVLGGGSNVLIADEGVRGLVIKNEIGGINYTETENHFLVTVGAGVEWDVLVEDTVSSGLWGLENLSAIPGTVGGGVVQNINAYGVTIAEVIVSVRAFHMPTKTFQIFTKEACAFAYRNSFFKEQGPGKEYVVTEVQCALSSDAVLRTEYKSASQSMEAYFVRNNITVPTPTDVRNAVIEVRTRIGMVQGAYKSAGSFFTNVILEAASFRKLEEVVEAKYPDIAGDLSPWHWPLPSGEEKVSAAFLMECTPFNKSAFMGKTFNETVGISPVHTLSLINVGGAKSVDVHAFAKQITDTVEKEFGVTLASEVCFL